MKSFESVGQCLHRFFSFARRFLSLTIQKCGTLAQAQRTEFAIC
jgi:hypothetical protein